MSEEMLDFIIMKFIHGLFMSEEMLDFIIMKSNISSDMNKPCWKLAKTCPQSQILFCSRENNLPTIL